MRIGRHFELPDDLRPMMRRAVVLEWVSIAYLISVVALMAMVMGASQAMRTAWIEDMLSLVPPAAFLVACHFRDRKPNQRFPYGYHRAVTIGFLVASLALLVMGVVLLAENTMTLIRREHASVGGVDWFGEPIWSGWVMLPVLVYSVIPSVILGRLKHKPAKQLHDKVLFADAQMNKADWMTGVAAMVGVIGIGLGLWWLDPLAAILISVSILHDGYGNTKAVIGDLMDREPEVVDHSRPSEVPDSIESRLRGLTWVRDVQVRLRENGHVYFGTAYIVPADESAPLERIDEARKIALDTDWRVHEVAIELVPEITPPE